MHKLGDVLTQEKIKRVLTARRNLYNAGVELLECDRTYAEGIKAELERHTFADYEIRFSEPESPLCVNCRPYGLLHGNLYYLGSNIREIPIDEKLFANDSHCMVNLRSQSIGIYEKDTGRAVVCDIADFPYTLIWSKPGEPKFVCIEPWHSLPSAENGSTQWEKKPAAAILAPGEEWSCTLSTEFVR